MDSPLLGIPAMVNPGQQHVASVDFHGMDPIDSWWSTINLTVDIVDFESVLTPALTFNAFKVIINSIWNDIGIGFTENSDNITTMCLAQRIGRVRDDHSVLATKTVCWRIKVDTVSR